MAKKIRNSKEALGIFIPIFIFSLIFWVLKADNFYKSIHQYYSSEFHEARAVIIERNLANIIIQFDEKYMGRRIKVKKNFEEFAYKELDKGDSVTVKYFKKSTNYFLIKEIDGYPSSFDIYVSLIFSALFVLATISSFITYIRLNLKEKKKTHTNI